MMDFREIKSSDRAWITACRDFRIHPFTALSFASLFSWRKTYGLTIAGDADFFVIHSRRDNAFFSPCGDKEKCRRFVSETCGREKNPHFLYLTREEAREMEGEGFSILLRDDLSEYISAAGSLAMEEGYHISKSYRDKIKHFKKTVPYSVRPLHGDDLPILREIARHLPPDEIMGDTDVLLEDIDSFGLLNLQGVLMETLDGRKGFMLGYEDAPETFTTTMTKHDGALPTQVTAVLLHELICQLNGKYRFINLEEDLGIAGLRRAKQLYSPIDLLNVYEAIK